MTANVRCAGAWQDNPHPGEAYNSPPCGWAGERFAMGKLTPNQERELRPFGPEWFRACADVDRRVRTAKPCPRCGGHVEPITTDSGRDG